MKNTFVKVLSMMMALMMVVGMFSMITVSAADCTHENVTKTVQTPSCGRIGYTKNVCDDCGEEWISDPKDKLSDQHDYSVVIDPQPATCEKPAQTKGMKCSVCGAVDPANKPSDVENSTALGHAFHKDVVVEADCDTDGYTTKMCVRCQFVDVPTATDENGVWDQVTNVVPAGHKFEHEVIDQPNASKCESGSIRATCVVCEYSYVIYETNTHNMVAIENNTDKPSRTGVYKDVPLIGTTCEFKYESGKYCTICGYSEMKDNTKSTHALEAVHGVTFEEGATIPAWYLGETIPGEKVTATLLDMSFNGKAFGAGTATHVEPTCTTTGYDIKYCTTCKDYKKIDLNEVACAVTGDKNSSYTVGAWIWIDADGNPVEAFEKDKTETDINKTKYHCEYLTRTTTCDECGEVVKFEEKAAQDHDYDWTVDGENNTKIQMGTVHTPKTCFVNGFTTETCEFCRLWEDYEPVVTVADTDIAAKAHTWSTTPTKYKSGFDCTNRSTWEDAVIYTCTYENCDVKDDPATTKVEQAEDPRDYSVAEGVTPKHDYEKKTQEATCVANAAYYNECKRCSFVPTGDHADVPKDAPAAGYNEKNHVVKTVADLALAGNNGDPLKTGAAATCTADQVNVYLCKCGVPVDVVVTAKLNHKDGTTSKEVLFTDLNYNGKFDSATEKNAAAFAGNCQEKAVAQGKYCELCKTITVKSVIGATNDAVHKDTNPTPIETVEPTCTTKGYDQKYYTCCGDILKVNFVDADPANHAYKYVPVQNQTCYATGVSAHYKCELCSKLFTEQNAEKGTTLAALVIAQNKDANGNLGHKWGTVIGRVEETCNNPGTKAHQICQNPNCGEYLIEGIADPVKPAYDKDDNEIAVSAALNIDAHGDFYMGFHADKAPTCDEEGYAYPKNADGTKKYCCSKCDIITVAKINVQLAALEAKENKTDAEKAKIDELEALKATLVILDHKNKVGKQFPGKYVDGEWVVINDCTKDTYVEYYCPDCKESWLDNFEVKDCEYHTYKTDKGAWIDQNPVFVWNTDKDDEKYDCMATKTAFYKCQHCDERTEGETTQIKKHTANIDGVAAEISFDCRTIDQFIGVSCIYCDKVVGESTAKHNPIKSVVEATCTTDGHCIYYCGNGCDFYVALDENGEEIENEYFPALKHIDTNLADGKNDGKVQIGHVDPDNVNGVDGYNKFSCGLCGATWTETVKASATSDIEVALNATNANGATDEFTDSSLVAMTVALKAADLINVWGAKLNLTYSENLTLEGYEFSDASGLIVNQSVVETEYTVRADEKGNLYNDYSTPNSLIITAFADFDENGKMADATINGEVALVTLYFRVQGYTAEGETTYVNVAGAEIVDSADRDIREGKGTKTLTIRNLMDYNNHGGVTLSDLLAANKILTGELTAEVNKEIVDVTYDVTLDVDKNGKIEAADLLHILNYINGSESYADIAALRA